jgi:hypothetical protein
MQNQSAGGTPDAAIYSAQDISVTKSLVKIGAQTYATANITSVTVATNPASQTGSVTFLLLGLLSIGFGALRIAASLPNSVEGMVQGAAAAVFGAGLIFVSVKTANTEKPTYTLILRTSGGEVRAFTDPSKEAVTQLSDGILAAIAAR